MQITFILLDDCLAIGRQPGHVIASVSCLLIIIVVVEGEIILLLIVLKTEVHQCRHPLFIVAVHLDQFYRAPLRSECGVYVFSSLHQYLKKDILRW